MMKNIQVLFYQCYQPAFIISISRVVTVSVTDFKVTEGIVHSLRFVAKQELLTISIATTAQRSNCHTSPFTVSAALSVFM